MPGLPTQFEKGAKKFHGTWVFHMGDMTKLADADIVTGFTPGFAGAISKWYWVVGGTPVTTSSKLCTLNLEINAVDVKMGDGITNSTISLTSAACTPMGKVVAGTAIGKNNNFDANDTISVEGTSTTAFSEGDGSIVIEYEGRIL